MSPQPIAEWTVMFYMDVKPEGFEASLQVSLDEMAVTGSSDKINIMVLLGRNKPTDPPPEPIFTNPSIYRVEKGGKILITTPPLFQIDNNTLGDPDVVRQFLEYCTTQYPAKRYMLSFWDHGTGSGVEAGTDQVTNAVNQAFHIMATQEQSLVNFQSILQRALQPVLTRKRIVSNLFNLAPIKTSANKRLFLEEVMEEDFLYVTEIRTAIGQVFTDGAKLDLISFDACWLQMFENGYTLKDCCRYMVASENLISANGMGYRDFFRVLSQQPTADADKVGAMLINASYLKAQEEETFTMSCVDLSKADEIAAVIDELVVLLDGQLRDAGFLSMVHCARFLSLSFFDEEDPADFDLQVVDLIYFTLKLVAQINYTIATQQPTQDQLTTYNKIVDVCQRLSLVCTMDYVVYKQIGSAMLEQKDSFKRWGVHGFSIFFPEDKAKYDGYDEGFYVASDGVEAMPFAVKHKWKAFLEKYLTLIGQ